LALACLVLLVQSALLIGTRWVEDENWLGNGSWTLVQEGRLRMPIFPADPRGEADVSITVHHLGMAASFAAFGLGIPQARATSAVAGVATVIVVFFLALELGGPYCAVLAGLLLATDTFLVVASRTARPEAYTVFFCWLALLLYARAIRRESAWVALAAGLILGVACLNHPLGLPFVLAIGVFLLARYGWRIWRQPVAWALVLGVAAPAVPYAMWCFSDPAHAACFRDVYLSKTGEPMAERIVGEASRWSDFIGLGSQRVATGLRIPVRLHVALALIAAFWYLLRTRRDLFGPAATLFVLNALWWVYLVNKGPRYLVMLSPLFALALGWVVAQSRGRSWEKAAMAVFALVMLTQVGSNAYWLYKYRRAEYPALESRLRSVIPAHASVYGATTFWLALHDRTYYAYDRTKWDYALEKLKPEYLILNDRVMVHGSGQGEDDFAVLRGRLQEFVREHGTLAGRVPDDFYGDLEVYRVAY
jgi:4-amino-4-deoxy-L-arabinose transferase-like glycosyltransferase